MIEPDYEALSRGISNDMSSEAIARRLDIASQLYRLARTLSRAEYVGPVESSATRGEAVREHGPEQDESAR